MQTVIGAFDDATTAQRALERIVAAGVDRGDVHIEPGSGSSDSSGSSSAVSTGRAGEHEGVMASIGHFFTNLFSSNTNSGYAGTYTEAVRRGSTVVVVDADDDAQAERAAAILHECGAVDVDERAEQWRSSGWTGSPGLRSEDEAPMRDPLMGGQDLTGRDAQSRSGMGVAGETTLKVVEEDLQVGKRTVDRGGVRVFERVSEKPVSELVTLREERARVERRAVDRPATAADLESFREGEIEVREMTQEPVVAKTARVVEEVTIGKDVQQRAETGSDTVRRKDVEVERIEGQTSSAREHAAATSDRTTGANREALVRDTLSRDRDLNPKNPSSKA